jgi:hypothetical protein
MNAQAIGPAPAIKTDPPAVGTVNSQEPTVALSVTRTDSSQPTGDIGASNNAERNASIGSPTTTPELFPLLALGLVVTGSLFRMVMMRIAAIRRRRIIIDCPDSYWTDDRRESAWEDNKNHRGAITEPEDLIEDLNRPLSANNYKVARPTQNDQWSENTIVKDRVLATNDDASERLDKLEQLRQDLDRLFRSQKAAVSWPVS